MLWAQLDVLALDDLAGKIDRRHVQCHAVVGDVKNIHPLGLGEAGGIGDERFDHEDSLGRQMCATLLRQRTCSA